MRHLGDVTKINGAAIEPVDIITFGAPCQDLSVAGKRAGMKNEAVGDDETTRSGLFFDAVRIIEEMREADVLRGRTGELIRPRYAIYENVPGALSSNSGDDWQAVLTALIRVADPDAPTVPLPTKGKWAKYGGYMGIGRYGLWSCAYRIHDAQYYGVAQRRRRVTVLCDYCGWTAGRILFDPQYRRETQTADPEQAESDSGTEPGRAVQSVAESLRGHSGQSGAAGEETPGGSGNGATESDDRSGVGVTITDREDAKEDQGALSFQERAGKPGGGKGILIQNERTGALSTLTNQSVLAPEYVDTSHADDVVRTGDTVSALQGRDYKGGKLVKTEVPDVAGTLDASYYKGCGERNGVEREVVVSTVCLEGNGTRESHRGDGYRETDTMYTLNTTEQHAVAYGIDQQGGKGGANYTVNVAPPILSDSHGTPHAVAYNDSTSCIACDVYNQEETGEIAGTVTAACGGTNTSGPKVIVQEEQHAVAYATQACGDRNNAAQSVSEELAYTIPANPMSDRGQAIVYGISPYASNAMLSDNPHSGIYEAETSRTLDLNGGSPACNQGGIAIVEPCLNSWDIQSKHVQPEDGVAESLYAGECRYGGGESYVLQEPTVYNGEVITSPTNQSKPKPGVCHALTNDTRNYLVEEVASGFSFGQSANARSLGYQEECSPTLRGGEGGNQKPVVLVEQTALTSNGDDSTDL